MIILLSKTVGSLETCKNLQYLEDLNKYFQPNLENIRSIHIIRIFLYTSADIPTSSTLLALLKLRTDTGVGGGGITVQLL